LKLTSYWGGKVGPRGKKYSSPQRRAKTGGPWKKTVAKRQEVPTQPSQNIVENRKNISCEELEKEGGREQEGNVLRHEERAK